ncbi:MAG: DUF2892 domain-containing protein [Syntrophaceae bacterium]|nr:DUF2892 domain-containing protein [Syntrophaceae bacterium]
MKFKQNMGILDRGVRVILAAAVGILYFSGNLTGLAATILGILALVFAITSIFGFCPLYVPFGLNTKRE